VRGISSTADKKYMRLTNLETDQMLKKVDVNEFLKNKKRIGRVIVYPRLHILFFIANIVAIPTATIAMVIPMIAGRKYRSAIESA
jgi:hypothetical protein